MNTVSNTQRKVFEGELFEAIERDQAMRETYEVPIKLEPIEEWHDEDAFSPIAMWILFSLGIMVILIAAGM